MELIYEKICKKLGCEPRNVKIPDFGWRMDDTYKSPFSVLTVEEIDYLTDNKERYLD